VASSPTSTPCARFSPTRRHVYGMRIGRNGYVSCGHAKECCTRPQGAGRECVSVFRFLFFQRRKQLSQHALQFDAAHVRRKVAPVTGERARPLPYHMIVCRLAFHAS